MLLDPGLVQPASSGRAEPTPVDVFCPLTAVSSPLVEVVPLGVPSSAARLVPERVRDVRAAAASADLLPLADVSGLGGFGPHSPFGALWCRLPAGGRALLDTVFPASAVFVRGGPFFDLLDLSPAEVVADRRLSTSGRLLVFALPDDVDGVLHRFSPSLWYQWLVLRALAGTAAGEAVASFDGFTELVPSPARPSASLARGVALYLALRVRGLLDAAATLPGFVRTGVLRS